MRARLLRVAVFLAVIEMVALLTPAVPSPTGRLAALLVVATPGPLATWFLDTFRGAARPITVALAAVLVTAAGAALLGVLRPSRGARPEQDRGKEGSQAAVAKATAAQTATAVEPSDPPTDPPTDPPVITRRALLSGLGIGGVVLIGLALLVRPGARETHIALAGRMRAARRLPPLSAAQDISPTLPGLAPTLTPVDDFYRIDTAITLPRVDRTSWRLRIHGRVEHEVVLDLDDLLDLGVEEHDVTIACVSNEVGGGLVGTARWTGVPLERVLALAQPRSDAEQVVGRSVDGWTGGFPIEFASQPDALVAVGMNGVELPVRHGYPARLIVPQLFGYVSATKWLSDIELTGWDEYDAYWIRRNWAKRGPIRPMARIDVPGRIAEPGTVRIAGVAWAPPAGVASVELRIDGGDWLPATCSDPLGPMVWRQWWVDVDLGPGRYELQVRAIDADGEVQPPGPRPVLPSGAEGWHTRLLDLRSA